MSDRVFRMSIGGLTFAVDIPPGYEKPALHPTYAPFLTSGKPDVMVSGHTGRLREPLTLCEQIFEAGPNWNLHKLEKGFLLSAMSEQALCTPDFSRIDLYCRDNDDEVTPFFFDYPLPEVLMINMLPSKEGLILHASGVKREDGRVLLFCGMSGAGKSTMARLWESQKKITVLSDDRIIIRKIDNHFFAYGTPWHGEAGHAAADRGEIAKIFFIEHASTNRENPLAGNDAVTRLLTRSFPPMWDKAGMAATLELADTLTSSVPCTVLGFVPDAKIIEFIRTL